MKINQIIAASVLGLAATTVSANVMDNGSEYFAWWRPAGNNISKFCYR